MTGLPFLPPAVAQNPGPPQAWQPRPYAQLLRGPTYRWWRPLLSLLVMAAAVGIVIVGSGVVLGILMVTGSVPGLQNGTLTDSDFTAWSITPTGLALTNLLLASLIVAAQLAVWGGFGWRPRWVASVFGGVRWSWLVRCYVVALLVVGVASIVLVLVTGGMAITPEKNAVTLAVVVLLTTPLQAAGEEYLFRGWMTQAIGSTIPSAVAGAVVAATVSSTFFALAHGQQDVWLFVDRFGFGLVASWLVWRTGGLEASIAIHGANNLVAFAMTLISGQLSDVLTQTAGSPGSAAVDVAMLAVSALVIDQLARRQRLPRMFRPPIRAW